MNINFRKVVDIAMTLLFIILMGYHITGSKLHEILGVIIFILFIFHHILNIRWYKSIFKGKHNFQRIFQIILDLLLAVVMIGMIISSIMISGYVFSFLDITTTMFARKFHMISTSWGFVLISIHVGMHIAGIINNVYKKMKNTIFKYVYYLIIAIIFIFGLYSLVSLKIWEEMFLLINFKFYNFDQSGIIFYIKYIAILNLFAIVTYFIFKIKKEVK